MNTISTTPVRLDYSNDLVVDIDEQETGQTTVPDDDFVHHWVSLVLDADEVRAVASTLVGGAMPAEFGVSVHLTDSATSQALNRDLRGVDKPTNVLSFPSGLPLLDDALTLGELVLCPDVVQCEAREQGKGVMDHWAHMLVHGSLHLVGFDHDEDSAAERMEALEIRILSSEGISDPYAGTA